MTKKISGKYIDSQNKYHVFYNGKGEYVKLTYTLDGKYCSHNHYNKEQILKNISGLVRVNDVKEDN